MEVFPEEELQGSENWGCVPGPGGEEAMRQFAFCRDLFILTHREKQKALWVNDRRSV